MRVFRHRTEVEREQLLLEVRRRVAEASPDARQRLKTLFAASLAAEQAVASTGGETAASDESKRVRDAPVVPDDTGIGPRR